MLQLNQILKHTNTSSKQMLWIMVLLMKETNAFVVKVCILYLKVESYCVLFTPIIYSIDTLLNSDS